jgi:hypothetical protein
VIDEMRRVDEAKIEPLLVHAPLGSLMRAGTIAPGRSSRSSKILVDRFQESQSFGIW